MTTEEINSIILKSDYSDWKKDNYYGTTFIYKKDSNLKIVKDKKTERPFVFENCPKTLKRRCDPTLYLFNFKFNEKTIFSKEFLSIEADNNFLAPSLLSNSPNISKIDFKILQIISSDIKTLKSNLEKINNTLLKIE